MFCKQCGEEMNENQAVCIKCDTKVGEGNKYCANCGKEVSPDAAVCLSCGVAIKNSSSASIEDKKVVAGILALFLGGFGIHNFYLGKTKKGVFKLLLCWTGIPAILALIDAIKIFTGSYEIDPEKLI